MAIKRYFADADNTITNAFQEDLTTRGTGSNMGQADILEVFSIYAQQSSTSTELSRVLLRFPISQVNSDRLAELIPASGNVSFFLNLSNATHPHTLPKNYELTVEAIAADWQEGNGLDMEGYKDKTYDGIGSNWINASSGTPWTTQGGDYHSEPNYSVTFEKGDEDLSLDVTGLVEHWLNGQKQNYGFGIRLSSSYEALSSANSSGSQNSYYTKKFFARSSEFFHDRPVLEARWNSSRRDNRGNFYLSSSWAPPEDNLNTLFMYNYVRGVLKDIANYDATRPVLKLYYSSGSVPEGDPVYFRDADYNEINSITATRVSKGVYKARFAVSSSAVNQTYPYLVDVWSTGSLEIHTGSAIIANDYTLSNFNPNSKYVVAIKNLKPKYHKGQIERFRLFVREKNWSPSIYTVAKSAPRNTLIESASYQICRSSDQKIVVPYGTGSTGETILSYDIEGNYFDLDTNLLEAGYTYDLKFSFYEDSLSSYREQPYTFKIRVDKDEY